MAEFQVRSDAVDVEHIMRQIRQRIQEKRGVDYSEEELRALANVKLEKFLDPAGVRSDLVQQFRQAHTPDPAAPSYAFEEDTLYETHRGPLRAIRRLLRPILKLFINPDPIVSALHIQAQLNARAVEFQQRQHTLDALRYEVMHNLVLELTRTTLEVRNLRMRLDAMAGRLDFDERRQRAFEGVVEYRKPEPRAPQGQPRQQAAGAGSPAGSPAGAGAEGDDGGPRTKRRRRRRRRVPSAGMPESGGSNDSGDSGGGQSGPPEGGEAPPQ